MPHCSCLEKNITNEAYSKYYENIKEEDVVKAYTKYLMNVLETEDIQIVNSVLFDNYHLKDPKLTEEVKKKIMVKIRPTVIRLKELILEELNETEQFLNYN